MDTVIFVGLFGIVSAFIGVLGAIYISRRNARRDSGKQLISEFARVETLFNQISSTNIHGIDPLLREAFPQLEEKIIIFERHLFLPWEKRGFRKAWVAYYHSSSDDRCQCYHHYMPFKSVSIDDGKESKNDNTETYRTTFKNNVENILKYANQK